MANSQRAYLVQKQQQKLALSPQQLQTVRMLELPVAELAEDVKNEIVDNIVLDEGPLKSVEDLNVGDDSDAGSDEQEQCDEYVAPESLFDYDFSDDDAMPSAGAGAAEKQEIPIGATKSFIDDLMEQIVNFEITDEQYPIIEYLIGSLDNRGFLSCSVGDIVDDLMIYHNIYSSEEEVNEVLQILQQFDPPGIGARDTRESLILQLDRKLQDANHLSFDKIELLQDARRIIDEYFELFKNNNLEKLQNSLGISSVHLSDVLKTIKELNLHPGLALCESSGDRVQIALPDFVVETDTEGNISFSLNGGDVPSFHVSQEYIELLKMMQTPGVKLSKHDKERFTYFQQKVDSARSYIESIRQRHHTLESTMKAIIYFQKKFFLSQNDDDLQKLILSDVAKKAGLDVSTISRVCKRKYALVDGTLYPLSYFFKKMRTNKGGEEIDGHKVEIYLKDIIDGEDKRKPFSDGELVELLKEKGIKIAIKTVNKYRNNLGIPTATKRKSI